MTYSSELEKWFYEGLAYCIIFGPFILPFILLVIIVLKGILGGIKDRIFRKSKSYEKISKKGIEERKKAYEKKRQEELERRNREIKRLEEETQRVADIKSSLE